MRRDGIKKVFDDVKRDDAAYLDCTRAQGIRALLCGTVTRGSLVHIAGHCITSFDGIGLIDAIRAETHDREILIAIIAILRSIVFTNVSPGCLKYYAPSNPNDVCQFWDEATAIADGRLPLLIDIVTDRCSVSDDSLFHEATYTRYTHLMLNCSTNDMYTRRLPWVYWWMVDPDNHITQSFRDVSCGYDEHNEAGCF